MVAYYLSRSAIQEVLDMRNLFPGYVQVGTFWKIPSNHTIGILIRPALLGTMRISEIDFHGSGLREQHMSGHLAATVVGKTKLHLLR